ncbi:dihydrodipicolinate synthase family protein [Vreelandella nanhaiensis]|uniref:Dihydrodipicolinate synthase family protein n=1 Tax=Vreelandella nanhaiensis TaxID=1258546 RepID=A0A3S1DR34_9GAMM|nr:dihydrodipicolinate synthase family protein [Halomonas nanhaiensis]RUR32263.1 dihydrodipicolinate synthase family protein [Halomonas nanhaiensis]
MNNTANKRNVWSPVMTPFMPDLSIDDQRFIEHCQWLLSNQVGLAVFGTNSEANSLSLADKKRLLELLIDSGISGNDLMPGTGSCNLEDTVALTRTAVEAGCKGVLMLPPFYYKGVTDDGLFNYFSQVVERVSDARLRIYLYHIPPVAQVPLSIELVERLRQRYPDVFVGIKDSGGDWAFTRSLIERLSPQGFEIFAGSERFLLDTLRAGGAGCISATANVNPNAIANLGATWQNSEADEQQRVLNRIRGVFEGFPMIPAMKAAKAQATGHDGWRLVRPPLVALATPAAEILQQALIDEDFSMGDKTRRATV